MSIVKRLVKSQRWISQHGPMGHARTAYLKHQFVHARAAHLFRGVFDSFEKAVASAPDTAPTSYDNTASAQLYLERLQLDDYDHPALFWMADAVYRGLTRVADIGGAVGIKYFAFQPFIDYPENLRWLVIDMPAVATEGRRFATVRGVDGQLQFSDQLADADGCEVLYASGALQYLDRSLPDILAGFETKPRRIIINTTPIHDRHAFFTLNSIGTAYCGYRVEAREPFIEAVQAQGYVLRDQWRNLGKRMPIIGKPEYSVEHYSGFCFDLKADADRNLQAGADGNGPPDAGRNSKANAARNGLPDADGSPKAQAGWNGSPGADSESAG